MQALPTGWVMEQFLTYQFLIEVNASWSVETEWGYVNLYQSLIEVNARGLTIQHCCDGILMYQSLIEVNASISFLKFRKIYF